MDSQVTDAIYSGGVLKPLGEVSLHESERVRLIIERTAARPKARQPALEASGRVSRKCASTCPGRFPAGMNCMIAFDTNVLIYSCDHSDPLRQRRAFELLAAAEDGVLLWQVGSNSWQRPGSWHRRVLPQRTRGLGCANSWTY